jgi:hypothetical protein
LQVIAIWSQIDSILAEMLTQFIRSDLKTVVSMLHSVRSLEAQQNMIRAAAEHKLPQDEFALFTEVEKATGPSRTRRHEFAHHLWGVPENIPNSVALLDPRDNLRGIAYFDVKFEEWSEDVAVEFETELLGTGQAPTYPDLPNHVDLSKVQCFRKGDLERDLSDAQRALALYLILTTFLFARTPQMKNWARQRLQEELRGTQTQSPSLDDKIDLAVRRSIEHVHAKVDEATTDLSALCDAVRARIGGADASDVQIETEASKAVFATVEQAFDPYQPQLDSGDDD